MAKSKSSQYLLSLLLFQDQCHAVQASWQLLRIWYQHPQLLFWLSSDPLPEIPFFSHHLQLCFAGLCSCARNHLQQCQPCQAFVQQQDILSRCFRDHLPSLELFC